MWKHQDNKLYSVCVVTCICGYAVWKNITDEVWQEMNLSVWGCVSVVSPSLVSFSCHFYLFILSKWCFHCWRLKFSPDMWCCKSLSLSPSAGHSVLINDGELFSSLNHWGEWNNLSSPHFRPCETYGSETSLILLRSWWAFRVSDPRHGLSITSACSLCWRTCQNRTNIRKNMHAKLQKEEAADSFSSPKNDLWMFKGKIPFCSLSSYCEITTLQIISDLTPLLPIMGLWYHLDVINIVITFCHWDIMRI